MRPTLLTIKPITVTTVLENATELFDQHWSEVCAIPKVMTLKPDAPMYLRLERENRLMILGAYQDDQLVGYSVNLVGNHLHYADVKVMNNDLLFVSESHRNSPLGLKLIKETEKEAKRMGCQLMLWHAKPNSTLDRLMVRKDYSVQDVIYSKEV